MDPQMLAIMNRRYSIEHCTSTHGTASVAIVIGMLTALGIIDQQIGGD